MALNLQEMPNNDINVTLKTGIPVTFRPKVLSFIGTSESAFHVISCKPRNVPEGKMDPFSRLFGNLSKLDKRHGIKAIMGFLKPEPVLKKLELMCSEGTLCEA